MNCFTEEQLNRISHLVREIEKLSDAEKLFLYLQLPCGRAEGKPKYNSGQFKSDPTHKKTDQETTQTYTWILSHLESDPNVSLPKQEVYDEYRAFCQNNRFEPMCVADFGKAMKHAFPSIKPRRLGQRGNSRYCYSGLRKKYKIQPPALPDTSEPAFCLDNDYSQAYNNNQSGAGCQRDNSDEFSSVSTRTTATLRPYEVMNLKVQPSSPHNQQQQQQQQQQHQYNTTNNSNGLRFAEGHLRHSTPQPVQNCTAENCQSMQSHPPVSLSNYNHPALTPMAGQSNAFSFQETLRPPGTPDDDDYRHNYQDVLPMSRYEPNSANISSSHQEATCSQTLSDGGSLIYESQLPGGSKSLRDLHDHQSSQSSTISSNLMVLGSSITDQPQPPDHNQLNLNNQMNQGAITAVTLTGTHFNLHHMNHTHNMESCASPFQSPAPTPYPSMGSYLSPEMPDYYSDDCIRYANS